MKILFAALHFGYFRNFESAIRELAERGHQVHLTGDEPEGMGGEALVRRLAAEYPGRVTWDLLPSLEAEPWYDAARRMRMALDYVRVLGSAYPPKLRMRARPRAARIIRWTTALPGGRMASLRALTRFERSLPPADSMLVYLRQRAPDAVVLTSLTYSRSQQLDVLKAARSLGIPVSAAIMSWDHLSSKALLHMAPDQVIVWNRIQKQEAVEMHGIPTDRIVETGAQCYDQWFTRQPRRTREAFCHDVGLRADRPFVLWVHSALSPTPEPPEPELVLRWIHALRNSGDAVLRETGVLVRPHPERLKEWNGIALDGFDNVAFHGRNPIDADAKDDYFDSLYYSSAVVGLVTSAFLEAAVVGRPVLTFTLPEYRMHQEEMIHFRYLMEVEGGLVHRAPDLETHLRQLATAIALDGGRDERNARFVGTFIRPFGLGVAATPAFADAVIALAAETVPATRTGTGWGGALATRAAGLALTRPGRWLVSDVRTDARDEHEEFSARALAAKRAARDARITDKTRRRQRRVRRDAMMIRAKEVKMRAKRVKSTLRMFHHRVAKGVRSAGRTVRDGAAVVVVQGLARLGVTRDQLPWRQGRD